MAVLRIVTLSLNDRGIASMITPDARCYAWGDREVQPGHLLVLPVLDGPLMRDVRLFILMVSGVESVPPLNGKGLSTMPEDGHACASGHV